MQARIKESIFTLFVFTIICTFFACNNHVNKANESAQKESQTIEQPVVNAEKIPPPAMAPPPPPPPPPPAPIAVEEIAAPPAPKKATPKDYADQRVMSRPNVKSEAGRSRNAKKMAPPGQAPKPQDQAPRPAHNTESYSHITENQFLEVTGNPLSTFSIDVDAASYSNVRRYITNNTTPPKDAIRIEELINYFNYDYPQPNDKHPFSISTEIDQCPWNKDNLLVHIGLQGRNMDLSQAPKSNLVFLLDVSGSMNRSNKLPLLKKALTLLVDQMRPQDRVAIVVYAGAAGEILPSTPFSEKKKILAALDKLEAGGSTAGGEGIKLAYKIAEKNFVKGGNNRIILATDGDFNIGASSDGDMARLIEEKRKSGVFLTTLGFGMGNYKDSKMETLADKGNGNYAYIDNIMEAKKVLVNELGGTLFTIAKDVKIQVEFNPAEVKAYRLIGYENRMLQARDFNDDKKDAGELGAGHTVTALYEVVPAGSPTNVSNTDPLKYQKTKPTKAANQSGELLTVKFRYKQPDASTSELITRSVTKNNIGEAGENFTFSAAVASWGMIMRGSEFKGNTSFDKVIKMAKEAKGKDNDGYRAEFIRLVEQAQLLNM